MSRKKQIKELLTIILSVTMILGMCNSIYANTLILPSRTIVTKDGMNYLMDSEGEKCFGWFQDSNGDWYYFNESDKSMKTGWYHDDKNGFWYYLNLSDGKMVTGWQIIDGKSYCFDSDGTLYVNTTTPDGFKVDENGVKVDESQQTSNEEYIGCYSMLDMSLLETYKSMYDLYMEKWNMDIRAIPHVEISKIQNGRIYGKLMHGSFWDFSTNGVILNGDSFVLEHTAYQAPYSGHDVPSNPYRHDTTDTYTFKFESVDGRMFLTSSCRSSCSNCYEPNTHGHEVSTNKFEYGKADSSYFNLNYETELIKVD